MSLRERLGRRTPGYDYTIGRILSVYAVLMVTLLLASRAVSPARRSSATSSGVVLTPLMLGAVVTAAEAAAGTLNPGTVD